MRLFEFRFARRKEELDEELRAHLRMGTGLMNMTKDQRAVVIGVMDDERQASVAEPPQSELEVYLPQMTPHWRPPMFPRGGQPAWTRWRRCAANKRLTCGHSG
jgi:hypothetical protein